MAAPAKKSFNAYQNMLKSGLKAMKKYSDHSRRGFILIVEDNTGLHKLGTKHLLEKFNSTKSCEDCQNMTWESASKLDTKDLNSEDIEDVSDVAAKASSTGDILAGIYGDAEVPKLPFDVDIMSEKEAGNWILPELKKDLVENGSRPVSRIAWGDPKFHPQCWADDLAEWSTVTNICHPQKQKLKVPIVEILKATIKNRLRLKGIDPKDHVEKNCDQIKAIRKQKARGFHKAKKNIQIDSNENGGDVPVHDELQEAFDVNIVEALPVANDDHPVDAPDNVVHDNVSYVIFENVETTPVDAFDDSFERDDNGFGRRVLPSRQAELSSTISVATCSPVESSVSTAQDWFSEVTPQVTPQPIVSSSSSRRMSGVTSPPAPKRQRSLLRTEDSEPVVWSRGRGKGGLNLRILGGRITKETSKAEQQKQMKTMWKQWLKGYTEEVNEVIHDNPKGLHIKCDDCKKTISKQSYLRHRTVNGCPQMNPKIKFYNWCN